MKLTQRKKQIEKLRKTGLTYEQIGNKYKISAERVRQILTLKVEYCDKHNRQFIGMCGYCKIEKDYISKINTIVKDGLIDQIELLSQHDRRRETVMKRIALVRILKDKYALPFSRIAKLFKRDSSSIKNLYYNKIK